MAYRYDHDVTIEPPQSNHSQERELFQPLLTSNKMLVQIYTYMLVGYLILPA